MKIKVNWDFALIKKDTKEIIVYDKPHIEYGSALRDGYLVNVKVYIKENGLLQICGGEVIWKCVTCKTPINELEEEVVSDDIEHYNGLKIFGKEIFKPYDYVLGWYKLKKTRKAMYLLNGYSLKVIK